jgi:hypothetical protein
VDNEFKPEHLEGLLDAIRVPHPETGWPHFVYSRREYVKDEGAKDAKLPEGASPLREWNDKHRKMLHASAMNNFVDTGDFLISRGAMYELAERTGCMWNTELRRFGDWELMCRLDRAGFRGQAVDQVSHIYHWTGDNLQTNRKSENMVTLPADVYERMVQQGLIKT